MKIAIVSQPFDVILPPFQSSVGYYTWSLARQLARSCDVTVYGLRRIHSDSAPATEGNPELCLVPASALDDFMYRARMKIGEFVQISSPASTSRLLFPDYGRRVAMDLSRRQFDVIHIQHSLQYAPVIRALNPHAKIVLQMHAEWFSQSNFHALQRRLDHVDQVIAVGDHIIRKTARDFPGITGRSATVHCAINTQEFLREKDYATSRGRKIKRILYCGAVSPHKGPHVLLDAFRHVVAEYPDVHLEFIGSMANYPFEETFDFNDHETVRRMAPFYAKHRLTRIGARLGLTSSDAGTYQASLKTHLTPDIADHVTFRGFIHRDELVERYYDSDLFVFPPVWEEGCGIPPIEAMAAGLPVVGTRSGGLLETVRDGQTGFLVEKNDPEALARQILRLLRDDNLRETMGCAGRRWVLAKFTWERVASLMEDRYRMLCRRSPRIMEPNLHLVPGDLERRGQTGTA